VRTIVADMWRYQKLSPMPISILKGHDMPYIAVSLSEGFRLSALLPEVRLQLRGVPPPAMV
jgi:hypothetical protein